MTLPLHFSTNCSARFRTSTGSFASTVTTSRTFDRSIPRLCAQPASLEVVVDATASWLTPFASAGIGRWVSPAVLLSPRPAIKPVEVNDSAVVSFPLTNVEAGENERATAAGFAATGAGGCGAAGAVCAWIDPPDDPARVTTGALTGSVLRVSFWATSGW